MRTAKRALSLLLIAVMVLLDIPQVAFAADEPVYQPDYNQYPIFSGQAKSKLDQFIETDGNSVFNVVGRFTKVYALGDYPDRLSFSSRLTENDYGYYQMGFSDVEKRIAAAGELGVALHAQITNDKHWSIYHALSTETSANVLRLSSGLYSHHSSFGELLHSYDSIEHASSGTYEYTDAGANAFPSTGASTWQTQGLTLEHRLSGDACGAPSTGNIAVMLADLGGPKVQSIYTTAGADPSSDRCEKFKAGETIYVHLRFDEPIRLSTDNAADLAGLTLKVAINDTKTGAEVGGTPVTANIVSLKSDTMTFKCVVPTSIDILGQPVTSNHYLSSAKMSDQSWVTSNSDAYDLTYVYEDDAGKHSFGPKDPADNPTLTKTSSLITDFAGNPILRSAVPIYLSQPCYMDNVAPTVASVTPVAVEKNANSDFAGTGQTFITAGDKIEITAEFSEEMQFYNAATGKYVNIATNEPTDPWYDHCRVGLIRAELNLRDDLGNAIVVTGKRAVTSSTGVNSIKVAKVIFELTVPPGARPIVYGSTAYALSINRITVDDAAAAPYCLCDSRGNPYVTDTVLLAGPGPALAPTRELWLDTLPPVAEVEYGPEGESDFYVRVSVDDPIDGNEDLNGQGAKFRSETTGMFGTFRWTNGGEGIPGFKYEYAYVSSPSVEAGLRTYWQAGENETQPGLIQLPDDGLHIHFRLLPDSDYSIVGSTLAVEVFDKAGNRFSTGSSPGSVDLVVDTIGPVVTRDSYAAEYVTDHGEIEASIRVKDVAGKVACIEYQWVEWADGGPPDAGATWYSATDLPSYSGSPGSLYKTFDASLTNLGLDEVHEYSLFVRTLDESGDELPGRARFDFEYDLKKPEHNLTFMTSPDGYHAKHSVLFTPGPPKTVEIGGVPETRTPTTIAMLKVPDETGHETDLHYVKSALMPGVSGAVYAQAEIFGIPDSWGLDASYFEDWHLADVSLDGSGGIVIARVNDLYGTRGSSGDPLPAAHRALQDLMNTYYGELNLRLIAAYSEELTVVDTAGETSVTVPDTALTADYAYALKSAYAGYLGDACAYKFDIAPLLDDGSKEDLTTYGAGKTAVGRSLNMGPPVGSDAGKFGSVQSLDGVKILVELENVKMPDWGTADLAGIDVHIYYEGTWGSPGFDEVYSTRLPAVTSQIFEIPVGVSDKSGLYSIVMRAQSLAEWAGSGKSLIQTEVRAYVEKATVGSYGVVKATTVADAGSTTAQLEYDYPLDSSPALEVYLSKSGDTALTFRAEFVPCRYPQRGEAGDNFFTRIYMRLKNRQSGAETGWVRMSAAAHDDDTYLGSWDPYGYGEVTFDSGTLALLGLQDGDELVYEVLTTTGVAAIEWDSDGEKAVTTLAPYSPPVQSVIVRMSDAPPALEMQLEPLTPVKSSKGVVATVKSLTSPASPVDTIVLKYRKGTAGTLTPFAIGDRITIDENGTYYFFAFDRFGNVSVVKKGVDWIDDGAPTLDVDNNSLGNLFDFTVTVEDASPVSLALQHEEDYWENVLGMADVPTQEDVPQVAIPGSEGKGSWQASGPSETGIYQVTTTAAGDVRVQGAFRYDPRSAPGATIPRTLTLIATDAAGNEARKTVSCLATNTATEYSGHTLDPEGGLKLTFTGPVVLTTPALSPADTAYGVEKSAVPIFASGNYTIEYADIFGRFCKESIVVDAYDGAYNVDISISETGPTRNDVVITIDARSNPGATLELPSDPALTVVPVTVDSKIKGATITVSSNRHVTFGVTVGGITRTRTIPVINIDRTSPTARVTWVFADAVVVNPATGKGETKGEVIASLVSLVAGESIDGANNKATFHRFTFNDQADYVLEYQDEAGNLGEPVTVSLGDTPLGAIRIVEKTFIDADGDAPTYNMAVSQSMPGGAFVKTAHYTQAEYTDALTSGGNPFNEPYHVTKALRLQFSVTDVNSTKLFVLEGLSPDTPGLGYENPATDNIEGVSWSGDTVDITDNVEICIVIVDAKDNMTLIPVTTTKIDNVPPQGEIDLVKVDFYKTRAYAVNLFDALSPPVTVCPTEGVSWDPSYNSGAGAYYQELIGNGTFRFTIEDKAGNRATLEAVVEGIDVSQPTVKKTTWSPSFIGPDRQPVSTAPPTDRSCLATLLPGLSSVSRS